MEKLINLALVLAQTLGLEPPPPRRVHPLWLAIGAYVVLLNCLLIYVCVIIALWRFLGPHLGPIYTPLVVAGLALIKVMIIALWLRYGAGRSRRPRKPPLSPSAPVAQQLAEAAALVKEHKGSALAAAVLVGMMAARREE